MARAQHYTRDSQLIIGLTKVESAFLLDVVVREGAPVLELFASKDKTLLVRGDAGRLGQVPIHVKSRREKLTLPCPGS